MANKQSGSQHERHNKTAAAMMVLAQSLRNNQKINFGSLPTTSALLGDLDDDLLAEGLPKVETIPSVLKKWNTNEEIASYLFFAQFNLDWFTKDVKIRPSNGSVFLYNKKDCNYKLDGFMWKKRKDGKMVREDHMRLKVKSVELIYANYVHSALLPTFHRRAYWLLWNPDVVLVHYLNTASTDPYQDQREKILRNLSQSTEAKNMPIQDLVEQLVPLISNELYNPKLHEWVHNLLNENNLDQSIKSQSDQQKEMALPVGSSSPNTLRRNSCCDASPGHKRSKPICRQASAGFSNEAKNGLLKNQTFISCDHPVQHQFQSFSDDSAYCSVSDFPVSSTVPNPAPRLYNLQNSTLFTNFGENDVDSIINCLPSTSSFQKRQENFFHNCASAAKLSFVSDDSFLTAPCTTESESQIMLNDADYNMLLFSPLNAVCDDVDFEKLELSHEDIDAVFNTSHDLDNIDDGDIESGINHCQENHNLEELNTEGGNNVQSLIITDYSPDWAYCKGGTKVLILGNNFQAGSFYECSFGSKVTQGLCIQSGVIRCHCPPNPACLVELTVKSLDHKLQANTVMFKYIEMDNTISASCKVDNGESGKLNTVVQQNESNLDADLVFRLNTDQLINAVLEYMACFGVNANVTLSNTHDCNLETELIDRFQTLFNNAYCDNHYHCTEKSTLQSHHQYGLTILQLCAMLDFDQLVAMLISGFYATNNQEINLAKKSINWDEFNPGQKDQFGRSIVVLACLKNAGKVAKYLLNIQTNDFVNLDDFYRKLPLLVAFERGFKEIVVQIVEKYVQLSNGDPKTKDFDTALWILTGGNIDASQLILENELFDPNGQIIFGDPQLSMMDKIATSEQNGESQNYSIQQGSSQTCTKCSQENFHSAKQNNNTANFSASGICSSSKGIFRFAQHIMQTMTSSSNHLNQDDEAMEAFSDTSKSEQSLKSDDENASLTDFGVGDFKSPLGLKLRLSPIPAGNQNNFMNGCIEESFVEKSTTLLRYTRQLSSQADAHCSPVSSHASSCSSSAASRRSSLADFASQIFASSTRDDKSSTVCGGAGGSGSATAGISGSGGAGRRSSDLDAFFNKSPEPTQAPLLLAETAGASSLSGSGVNVANRLRSPLEINFQRLTLSDREQRELYEAAKVIQNAYRQYKQRVQNRRQLEMERHAATVIQSYYRRYKQFCYLKKVHRAAALIQKYFRTYKAKKRRPSSMRSPPRPNCNPLVPHCNPLSPHCNPLSPHCNPLTPHCNPLASYRNPVPPQPQCQTTAGASRLTMLADSAPLQPQQQQRHRRGDSIVSHRLDHDYGALLVGPSPATGFKRHQSNNGVRGAVTDEELRLWKEQLAAIKIQHAFRDHVKRQAAARTIQRFMRRSKQKLQGTRVVSIDERPASSILQHGYRNTL